MVQEFNILNITYPFMLANDVTISKKKMLVKKSNFSKSKMAAGGHIENHD